MTEALTDVCKRIYSDTRLFYYAEAPKLGAEARGFKILYGPPVERPPVFFIGYQPGGKAPGPGEQEQEQKRWPPTIQYVTEEKWALAKNMRRIFGTAFLNQCAGANALFLRSPEVRHYSRKVSKELRCRIADFCIPRVSELVREMKPHLVVLNGLCTADLFGITERDTEVPELRYGKVANVAAVAVRHLSYPMTLQLRERTAERIKALAGCN